MTQYIDKSTLVAEIKKRYEYWREKEHNSHSVESETRMSECQHLLLLLNSFEVKEVDLEKEIREYLSTYWPEKKELHPFLGHTAKQFFELGMAVSNKAQKGE